MLLLCVFSLSPEVFYGSSWTYALGAFSEGVPCWCQAGASEECVSRAHARWYPAVTVPSEVIDAGFALIGAILGWLAKRLHISGGK